jgi:DNA sulfur modification protein DndD
MRISKLELHNIGPFVGSHEIDLATKSDQNIVLIGGKNGAGKTTLLGSIKLGLFGARYYGFQTESKTYFIEVEKFLNTSKRDTSEQFKISISFDVTAGYQKNLYQIERLWSYNGKGLVEIVRLYEHFDELKQLVSDELAEELINKIFNEYPPRLIDSFIFDGEAINEMIRHDKISEFLSQSFYSLFRLNMVNDLSVDLQSYIKNGNSDKSLNQEELNLIEKRNDIKAQQNKLKFAEHQLKTLQNQIDEYRSQVEGYYNQFERLGGMTEENKKAIRVFLSDMERNRTKNSQKIRHFLENDIILSILEPQIRKLSEKVIEELPQYLMNHLDLAKKYLGSKLDFTKILKELSAFSNNQSIFSNHEELLSFVEEELNNSLLEYREIQTLILSSDVSHDEFVQLKTKLNKSDESELQDYIVKISVLNEQVEHTQEQFRVVQLEFDKLKIEYDALKSSYEKVESEYKKKQKLTNSFSMALQVIEVLDAFRHKELERRLREVAKLSIKYFSKTHGKKDFIANLEISEFFDISLTSSQGHSLQLEKLSAGEKQLMIGSIIKAMFELAKRKEFFVFDTPLARLDQANRKAFISNVISPMSEQVIILSTNEEITGANFKLIKDKIFRSYTLVYDSKSATSQIMEGYDYERV